VPAQLLDAAVLDGNDALVAYRPALADIILVCYRRYVVEWQAQRYSKAELAARLKRKVQGLDFQLTGTHGVDLDDLDVVAALVGRTARGLVLDLLAIAEELERRGAAPFRGKLTQLADDQIGEREADAPTPGETARERSDRINARRKSAGVPEPVEREESTVVATRPPRNRPRPGKTTSD
jgi:hypothetical protein